MRSKEEIEKRRDMFKALAQETSSKIANLDIKLRAQENPTGCGSIYLAKEKESLHTLLGIANSQWAELMWVLGE